MGNLKIYQASAGSGKTYTLAFEYILLLFKHNEAYRNILAVTFTNKAAGEMRQRAQDLLQVSTRSMWIGTFHGIAHRLLRMHWQDAGLQENFQILDS